MEEILLLALLLLAVTVIEQAVGLGPGPANRVGWQAALWPASIYAVLASVLTGNVLFALVFLGLVAAARELARQIGAFFPPSLWSGLGVIALPYLGAWLAWAGFHPPVHPVVLQGFELIWRQATFSAIALPVEQLTEAASLANAYIFAWGSGTFLTRTVLGLGDTVDHFRGKVSGYERTLSDPGPAASAPEEAGATLENEDEELFRAGRLIGNLERFLVLTLTLAGQYTAIGFVIAAKSLARFDMARHRAEYFLVGTLTSLGIALTVGILVRWVMG